MRKLKYLYLLAPMFLFVQGMKAQSNLGEQIGRLINDALFYSDAYLSPATDAAVYQSASGWMTSPRERKLWDVTLSLHANVFYVPQRDRTFQISNSDLTFFQLEHGQSATVPSALGNEYQLYLKGQLGNDEIEIESPRGIDMEVVSYGYLQGSLAVGLGTELIIKYSPEIKLTKTIFQVYGAGIKHNFSRYFTDLQEKKIHLAILGAYSRESVTSNFLDVTTDYGTLGINTIKGMVKTWQLQVNGSKEFGKFEAMAGFLVNRSEIKYEVAGSRGTIEDIVKIREVLNNGLKKNYKMRTNYIGEASVAYNMGHFSVQAILAFGKFVNNNVSLQYTF